MDESFIPGLYVFAPSERSPSFVKAKLSIKPEQLQEWLKTAKTNEKGYVSIDVLEAKSGKWYGKLDTYVRKEVQDTDEINPEDVPF